MAQAPVSTSTLAYVPEVVYGVTPATPAFIAIDRVDYTPSLNSDSLSSETIRSDRQTTYARRGNSSVEGDLVVELTPDNYDDFIEAALQGTWTSNVVKIGKVQRSFTFEQGFDFGTASPSMQYRLHKGMMVGSMSLEVNTDDLVQITFGLTGTTESAFSGTSADASGYTAVATKPIYYHEDGSFNEGGSPVAYLQSISLELNNNVTGERTLGTTGYHSVSSGKVNVTGTVTGLFESVTLYNKYVNNTDSSLSFTLGTAAAGTGETLTFTLHKVRYTSGGITASGDAGVTVELDFEASYDATAANTMTITRSA